MSWVCPTLGRPEKLRELAESWERNGNGRELNVRIWSGDPRREDYFKETWPRGWHLYESEHRDLVGTLNEWFTNHPQEEFYGFIQDDIVLLTPDGIPIIEALAHPFYISYPNDALQRNKLCATFCLGGDLVRLMGWWAHPAFKKDYIDTIWMYLGQQTGLLRYAADVVWEHRHLIAGKAEWDPTYSISYGKDLAFSPPKEETAAFERYMKSGEFTSDVNIILRSLLGVERFWIEHYGQKGVVPDNAGESVQISGVDSGGVGGRDCPGGSQEPGRDAGRVQGGGPPDGSTSTVQREDPKAGAGPGSTWVATRREYKYPDADVVICVPSTGTWQARTAASIALMMADFLQSGVLPGLRSARVHLHTIESSMLSKNREDAVRTMMQSGRTHILFVDSDMVLPPNALRRLLWHDLPFVAANCTTREFPPLPTAHGFDGSRVDSKGKTGTEVVRQVGLAVALIRRDVFMRTQPPHFLMDWIPSVGGYCGEDVYFSQVVRQAGFEIVIDHDLSNEVGHVGWAIFGQGQVGCQPPPDWRGK